MNKFREWYMTNWVEINWFIIGWCTMAAFNSLERGDLVGASINATLAVLNYFVGKR